jgi:hypothetical protein
MRVLFCENESDHRHVMWEVSDGNKWWSVVWRTTTGDWVITAGKSLRKISPTGKLGKSIIAAVKAAK